MISMQIQLLKPDSVPKTPYAFTPSRAPSEPTPAASKAAAKGKQPASKTAGKSTATSTSTQTTIPPRASKPNGSGRQVPIPPGPHPPLSNRVSPYSPALVSGVLIETVKAGMSAQEAGGLGAGGGMGGKGKRKVVRVRA